MSTTATQPRFATGAGGAKAGGTGGEAAGTAGTEAAAKKKGSLFKSKKFLIILVVVLAVGGGAYKFLMPTKVSAPVGGDVVPMDPMTLNLTDGHYLKIATAVQLVKGKATPANFSSSQAAELVIDQFSNRPADSLSSNAARKKLTSELLVNLKKAYPGEVYDVFLTQFVTQ